MSYLAIAVRFLGDRYHGRTDNGHEPEWPPSPLRFYQAVLAGAAPRWHDLGLRERELPALEWLQSLEPPRIIGPRVQRGRPVLKYVRENLSDVDPEKRDAKVCRPTLFRGTPRVTYYWWIGAGDVERAQLIVGCARHCRALGWGIDMAVADGAVVECAPELTEEEEWIPMPSVAAGVPLRVPQPSSGFGQLGTLGELMKRFVDSLERIAEDGRNPVAPLSAFRTVGYRRSTDPPARSVAAFSLLDVEARRFRAFSTPRCALSVAGMMRWAVAGAATRSGWSESRIAQFVLGHGESNSEGGHVAVGGRRFAYLPLPSIEGRGEGKARVVGGVRRVLLSALDNDCEKEVAWARRALSGQELVDEGTKQAVVLLSLIPENDRVVQCYTRAAAQWATVTPVVLPGYDDPRHYRRRLASEIGATEQRDLLGRLEGRIDGLLRKAIVQAGFSRVLAEHAELDWRKGGFWPGTDLADRYGVPDHLNRFPRLHVKVQWRDAQGQPVQIPGPICFGGGRFYGLGLFAAV